MSSTLEEAFKQLNTYPLEETCKPFRISNSGYYWCASFVKENNVKNKEIGFNLVLIEIPSSGSHISFLYKEDAEEFKQLYGIQGRVYQSKEEMTMYRVDKNCSVPIYISRDPKLVRKDITEIGQWYVDRMAQLFGGTYASDTEAKAKVEKIVKDCVKKSFRNFTSTMKSNHPGISKFHRFYGVDVDLSVSGFNFIIVDKELLGKDMLEIVMRTECPIPKANLQIDDVCEWKPVQYINIKYSTSRAREINDKIPYQIISQLVEMFAKDKLQSISDVESWYSTPDWITIKYSVASNSKNHISMRGSAGFEFDSEYILENESQDVNGTINGVVDQLFLKLKTEVENFITKNVNSLHEVANELSDYLQNAVDVSTTSDFITIDFDEVK